jgi:formate-dependent nitrite reductase membrane component NrfD/ferredoxin
MYRRRDGIVDFDPERCIGCKCCQQACPYDAIYIDPGRRTAAKCNFCAHRVEVGMGPACVAACPEHALVVGDIDDPASAISELLGREPVRVRRPELGTEPKLFYIAAEESAIVPGQAANVGAYLFATVNSTMPGAVLQAALRRAAGRDGASGNAVPGSAGSPAVVSYDVEHERPWGWQVPAYMWAKALSTGALLVPALARLIGGTALPGRLERSLCLVGLLFLGLTLGALVGDLSRPERFLRVLSAPQWRSWVARGSFCLVAYGVLCAALGLASWAGAGETAAVLLWPTVVAGLLGSVYTAFLFGQCRGRELWQTPLSSVHLVAQCLVASGAVLVLVPGALGSTTSLRHAGVVALAAGLGAHALLVAGELGPAHRPAGARQAARLLTKGPLGRLFWGGAVGVGCAAPAVLLVLTTTSYVVVALAGAASLAGLWAFEWCFVMAGQAPANS